LQAFFERRRRLASFTDSCEEVADLVGEGVFPADDVPLRPPGFEVGVFGFVDQDPAEALLPDRDGGVQEAELVQVLQVKGQ